MEPPGQPEDSHPSDSNGASEARPAPSTTGQELSGLAGTSIGSVRLWKPLVKHRTHALGSFSSPSGSAR